MSGGPQDYDPRQMGGMMRQAQQQQPDLLQGMLGQGGALSNPPAKMAMAGVAAIAAQRLMGGQQGGGGGLLGGLLGQRRPDPRHRRERACQPPGSSSSA